GNNKQVMNTARAIRKGIENQVKRLGFSLIEVLSPCPTIWKLDPVDAQKRVLEEMPKTFPLGVFRDRTKEAQPRPEPAAEPALTNIPQILGLENKPPAPDPRTPAPGVPAPGPRTPAAAVPAPDPRPPAPAANGRVKIAGFGG